TLFLRTSSGYLLTPAGEAAFELAEKMERSALELLRRTRGMDHRLSGEVRLSTTDSLAVDFVLPALARLHLEHPDIRVLLDSASAVVDLPKRETDIAIRTLRPENPDLILRKLASWPMGLFASADYLRRNGVPVPGERFRGHDLVMYEPYWHSQRELTLGGEPIRDGRVVIAVNSNMMVRQALARGLGLCELPLYMGERNRAGHLPRLSLYASSSKTHSASESTYEQKYDTDSVGLRLSLPLFEGGRVSAATRQAGDKYAQAQAELDAQVASVINDLHSQFDLTASSLAKVRAYEMAVAAAREQVTATRRSVAGGERVNRDVLDAEQQFYGARRDLAEARYAYLNAWLRLRQLAGVLEDRDLAVLAAYFGAGEGRAQVAAAIR
ncbi:LysR substrate-binding domain-containing protein, partial [Pseudomonas aeruginosa]|nr:LysR substrate-binding domain-containing protein [Pseudomonas aeruginosa]